MRRAVDALGLSQVGHQDWPDWLHGSFDVRDSHPRALSARTTDLIETFALVYAVPAGH